MKTIFGYDVLETIHTGSNSLVYRARKDVEDQTVILKVLNKSYPQHDEITRYRREHEITRSLGNRPGIIEVYDLQEHQNTLVMILEDFGACSLDRIIKARSPGLREFLKISTMIAGALAEIHDAKVMHKDINPSNIVYNQSTGRLKIIDFGIAAQLSLENPDIKNPEVLEGTLPYLSPEQTGRMNRTLDYRTDFYSLGVTLYELLTGVLPHSAADALEMVHCHIARHPVPPHVRQPEIPEAVSEIVMKLLAKNAEERYECALGVKADLEECRRQLDGHGAIRTFTLGRHDISARFRIPRKLYGREEHIQTLMNAFDRVAKGASEIILVSGQAGIGKTSLVKEIYKPLTQQRGYFVTGKFDRFGGNIPYSAFVSAFRDLVKQLLTENETQLRNWRTAILKAVGINGRIITEVIPELELIIGPPPSVLELDPLGSKNRFDMTFRSLMRVFCAHDHPLAVFLDDLQWADSASLTFLETVMTDSDIGYLLVVGAYRNDEVDAAHPFTMTQDRLKSYGAVVGELILEPLSLDDLTEVICDTVHRKPYTVAPLAELVEQKTGGNPFFVNVFLKALNSSGALTFDRTAGTWSWDVARIHTLAITENVAHLLAGSITKLRESTSRALQIAACIGNEFELEILSAVSTDSPAILIESLKEAVSEGLIWPLGDGHKSLDFQIAESSERPQANYRFAHDHIRQAAYSLVPLSQRPEVHRRIGQVMLRNKPAAAYDDKIFEVVNHLYSGMSGIQTHDERRELARLSLLAGKKAKSSVAYGPALTYLRTGIDLLGKHRWTENYDLTLSLCIEAAEAAYSCAQFGEMGTLAADALEHAENLLDRAKIYEIKIRGHVVEKKFQEAVRTALDVLGLLGERFPAKPTRPHVIYAFLKTRLTLAKKEIEDLLLLQEMADPTKLAVMRIFACVGSAVYYAAPNLCVLMALRGIQLSVGYGNSPESCWLWAVYGFMLCGKAGDISLGSRFGKLALTLGERPESRVFKSRTAFEVNGFIRHWTEHAKVKVSAFEECYRDLMEVGDLEYAALSAYFYCNTLFVTGAELNGLEGETAKVSDRIHKLGQKAPFWFNEMYRQVIRNLMGTDDTTCDMVGEAYDERHMLPIHEESNDISAIHVLNYSKLFLNYHFGNFHQAFKYATIAANYAEGVSSTTGEPLFIFYSTLAGLAVVHELSMEKRRKVLKQTKLNLKKMKKWSDYCPENYSHKWYLLQAEQSRVLRELGRAICFYERATVLARENGYIQEEALAYELGARFCLGVGLTGFAKGYLTQARYCYQRWGAQAKVKDLNEKYADVLLPTLQSSTAVVDSTTFVRETTTSGPSKDLDWAAVIKAAQAISGEIMLGDLLKKMLMIILETSGAQKGAMILATDKGLRIEAEAYAGGSDIRLLQSLPVEDSDELSNAVVNFVARTGETVALDDATMDEAFVSDPYVRSKRPKSVLCAPIIHQNKTTAIVYFENNAITGAFSRGRIEVVRLLCSQAAIALENAHLYDDLEQRVTERTKELEEAKNAADSANRSKSAFLTTMSHELRTPLNAIIGFSEILEDQIFGRLNEKQLRYVSHVWSSGRHLLELINDILDLAKVESGKMELNVCEVNVRTILESSQVMVKEKAAKHNLRIEIAIADDVEASVLHADEIRLKQIINNLLVNAVKFTPDGGAIRLEARVAGTDLLISVSDTGMGIDPVDQERIFRAFEQVDGSQSRTQQGTGLGLALTRRMVEIQNGQIWVESRGRGHGSTFTFAIPAVRTRDP